MNVLDPAATLADIVNLQPSLARELETRGLDYCCGGAATLEDACTANHLAVGTVISELTAAMTDRQPASWSTLGIVDLTDHIKSTHHAYLWAELPRLAELVGRVLAAHVGHHAELVEIATCFHEIRSDLEPHLLEEERVLFPMIRELAAADAAPEFTVGSIENPISVMLNEHDAVGNLLRRLRELTDGYRAPADGCGSYVALFAGFEELEADTHLHIHKENNVLFPSVVAAERRLAS